MNTINKPGIYDIDIDSYHGQPCIGPSISASGLRTILLQSPAHFWSQSSLNPSAEKAETHALRIGKAAHAWVLGEPEFAKYFVISPYDDFRKTEAKEWRENESRIVLKSRELEVIKEMAIALRENPPTSLSFTGNGKPEQSLIWCDEETGVWLKARPDWLPDDPEMHFLQEYKTAASAEPGKASRQAFDLGYDMQAALAVDAIKAVTGHDALGIAHVIQEKTEPYASTLLMFSADQIEFGRMRYRKALNIFATCLQKYKSGAPISVAWPGYTDEPQFFITPYWVTKAMQAEQETKPNERRYASEDYASAP